MSIFFNPLKHPVCFAHPKRLTEFSAWHEHIPFAMLLVDLLKPRMIVELGTQYGDSYCAFCQAVQELHLSTQCYAIDTWQGDPHTGFYGPEVLADLRAHHDPLYGGFSELIQSTFDEALQHFEDGTIDLLHLDGYHTYEAVKHDFESWRSKMSQRGVVLFHDTNVREHDFGVWRFWDELRQIYPHFEFVHGHGLGMLAVGRKQPKAVQELLKTSVDDAVKIRNFFFQLGRRFTLEVLVETLTAQVAEPDQRVRALPCRVSVCIPTKDAGPTFADNLQSFLAQEDIPSLEIVIVDSGSTDGTLETAKSLGARVFSIAPEEFNHGETRNLLARHAGGDILVFTVQDARPANPRCLAELIQPLLENPEVAGVTGKQVAQPDADLFARWEGEQHNRFLDKGWQKKSLASVQDFCQRDLSSRHYAIAFDNVFSAIRRTAWERFPFTPTEFAEDLDWAFRVLLHGGSIVYNPSAMVLHSHNRTPFERFQRSFVTRLALNRVLQISPEAFTREARISAGIHKFHSELASVRRRIRQSGATVPKLHLPRTPTYVLARLWQRYQLPGERIINRWFWTARPFHILKQRFNYVAGLIAAHTGPLSPADAIQISRDVAAAVLGDFLGNYYYSCLHRNRISIALERLHADLHGHRRPTGADSGLPASSRPAVQTV